jgi:hypothetical protein
MTRALYMLELCVGIALATAISLIAVITAIS